MGIASRILGALDSAGDRWAREQRAIVNVPAWVDIPLTGRTSSGRSVTPTSALNYGPYFAAIRNISEDVAKLPLITYRRLPMGKERATDHPLYPILHDVANPWQTAFEFRQLIESHRLAWGNGYAMKEYDPRNGAIRALWPLRPDRMLSVERFTRYGRPWYTYQWPDGEVVTYDASDIFHVRGIGDELVGYSIARLARESIGAGLATEEWAANFWANDARPGGFMRHPGRMSKDAHERLRATANEHRGSGNAHKWAVLEEGMDVVTVGIPPEDAQFLETRQFQVREIARWFRLPPHKLGDLADATFSNIEHQGQEYVADTLGAPLVSWEQSIALRLMTESDRRTYFAEHLVDALLRADTLARFQAYAVGIQNKVMVPDEARERENLNPLPNGEGARPVETPNNTSPA